jgi:hypothetical protein
MSGSSRPALKAGTFPIYNEGKALGASRGYRQGLEFDFSHVARNKRTVFSVPPAGIIAPFSLGYRRGNLSLSA